MKFFYFVFQNSVLGSGGIMYINGRIVSGPLESLIEVLVPKNLVDLDKVSDLAINHFDNKNVFFFYFLFCNNIFAQVKNHYSSLFPNCIFSAL